MPYHKELLAILGGAHTNGAGFKQLVLALTRFASILKIKALVSRNCL
jgi:hypothetical protein